MQPGRFDPEKDEFAFDTYQKDQVRTRFATDQSSARMRHRLQRGIYWLRCSLRSRSSLLPWADL